MSLSGHAGRKRQAHAVAGGRVGVGGGAVDAPGTTGREDDGLGADRLDRPVDHVVGHDAAAGAVVVTHELGDEVLLVRRDVHFDADGPERVQDHQAGDVGGEARAREAGAAERALRDLARGLVPAEDRAPVLELDDLAGRVFTQDRDGVLVTDVVRALDRVKGVILGIVIRFVPERGVDATLSSTRVAAHRVDLGHKGDIGPRLFGCDGRAHPGQPCSHHHDVMGPHAAFSSDLRYERTLADADERAGFVRPPIGPHAGGKCHAPRVGGTPSARARHGVLCRLVCQGHRAERAGHPAKSRRNDKRSVRVFVQSGVGAQ